MTSLGTTACFLSKSAPSLVRFHGFTMDWEHEHVIPAFQKLCSKRERVAVLSVPQRFANQHIATKVNILRTVYIS